MSVGSETERERFHLGDRRADFYARALTEAEERREHFHAGGAQYVRAEDMPWEDTPHGRLKHLSNEHMGTALASMNAFIQEIPPGGRSGKHRHFAEEFVYVIEGRGYDLHWEPDMGATEQGYTWPVPPEDTAARWDWEEGDSICIPPMVVHQHVNLDPDKPVRLLCALSTIYKTLGFGGIEQIEPAPEPGPGARAG